MLGITLTGALITLNFAAFHARSTSIVACSAVLDARHGVNTETVAFDLVFITDHLAFARFTGLTFSAFVQAVSAVVDIGENIPAHTKAHFLTDRTFALFRIVDACTRDARLIFRTADVACSAMTGIRLHIHACSPAQVFVGFFVIA